MSVTFINAMRVAPEDEQFFLAMWDEGAAHVAAQPGFIATSLHKTTALNKEFQYYTIAVWEDGDALATATSSPWWREFTERFGFSTEDPRFTSVPALCEIVRNEQGFLPA
eukprot:s1_g722.t1